MEYGQRSRDAVSFFPGGLVVVLTIRATLQPRRRQEWASAAAALWSMAAPFATAFAGRVEASWSEAVAALRTFGRAVAGLGRESAASRAPVTKW